MNVQKEFMKPAGVCITQRQILLCDSGTWSIHWDYPESDLVWGIGFELPFPLGDYCECVEQLSGKGLQPGSLVYGFCSPPTLSSQSHTEPPTVAETWLPRASPSAP